MLIKTYIRDFTAQSKFGNDFVVKCVKNLTMLDYFYIHTKHDLIKVDKGNIKIANKHTGKEFFFMERTEQTKNNFVLAFNKNGILIYDPVSRQIMVQVAFNDVDFVEGSIIHFFKNSKRRVVSIKDRVNDVELIMKSISMSMKPSKDYKEYSFNFNKDDADFAVMANSYSEATSILWDEYIKNTILGNEIGEFNNFMALKGKDWDLTMINGVRQ